MGIYGGQLPAGPCTLAFHEAPKHVQARLEKKWLARFMEGTLLVWKREVGASVLHPASLL